MEATQSAASPSAPYHASYRTGGEGTSGSAAVAGPSAAGPSATTLPAAPTRSEGTLPAGWQEMFFSGGESALNDATLARSLLRGILLPQDKERYRGRTTTEIMSSFYTTITSALLDADVLERGLAAAVELGRTWAERVAAAEADKEVAQDRLEAAERKIGEAQGEVDRLGRELQTTHTNLERSLEETQLQISARQTAETSVSDITYELHRTEEALEAALTGKAAAIERTEELTAAVRTAEAAARAAEAATRAAEAAAAAKAVEDFKTSEAFKEEVLEASDACYLIGFRSCRAEVAEAFPDLDLSGVASPVRASEAAESESEPADDVPSAATPAVGAETGSEPADDVASAATPAIGARAEVVESEEAASVVGPEPAEPGAAPEEVAEQVATAGEVAPTEQPAPTEVPSVEEEEAVEEVVAEEVVERVVEAGVAGEAVERVVEAGEQVVEPL